VVTTHVDGAAYFGAIANVLDTMRGPGDRLYITSWNLDLATRLRAGAGEPDLAERLLSLAEAGADIRLIVAVPRYAPSPFNKPVLRMDFWRWPFSVLLGKIPATNVNSVRTLRGSSPTGPSPLANRVLMDWGGGFDSRHEKATIAYSAATGELQAFVGGIDYVPKVSTSERHAGAPQENYWHDAGVQLQGGAAEAVLDNFWTRWDETATLPARTYGHGGVEEPFNPAVEPKPEQLIPPQSRQPANLSAGSHADAGVRIWRSYGPLRVTALGDSLQLAWHTLPGGISEVSTGLTVAIDAARRYIYVEDQTLNPSLLARAYNQHSVLFPAISAAAARGVKVVFVTQGFGFPGARGNATPGMSSEIQALILGKLTAAQRQNFAVYYVKDTWVHSKLVLVDDEFVSIGSANFWDRSLAGDESEVNAAIVHPGGPASLVADLRVRLWREHLRVPQTDSADASLRDLDVSLGYFRRTWGTGTVSDIPDSALQEMRGSNW
jgi:phosphatidylserine/phosphatidylglycerophosphate/cardiolipin synthase-like enzyme